MAVEKNMEPIIIMWSQAVISFCFWFEWSSTNFLNSLTELQSRYMLKK